MILHNSSIEYFYQILDNEIVPFFRSTEDQMKRKAESIASDCSFVLLFLHFLKEHLW